MTQAPPESSRGQAPLAREVTLRKLRSLAPPFHRHIARSRLVGTICQVGQRVVVYEIVRTDPPGPVEVTAETLLHFDGAARETPDGTDDSH